MLGCRLKRAACLMQFSRVLLPTHRWLAIAAKPAAAPLLPGGFSFVDDNLADSRQRMLDTIAPYGNQRNIDFKVVLYNYYKFGRVFALHWSELQQSVLKCGNVKSDCDLEKKLSFLMSSCTPDLMPACLRARRIAGFEELWRYAKARQLLTSMHYELKLRMLAKHAERLSDWREFANELTALDAKHAQSAAFYAALLDAVSASGDVANARAIVAELRERCLPLTARHFEALLLAQRRSGDLVAARAVLQSEMAAAGLAPSTRAYAMLAACCFEQNQICEGSKLLHAHSAQFTDDDLLCVLHALINLRGPAGNADNALQLVSKLLPTDQKMNVKLRSMALDLLWNGRYEAMKNFVQLLSPTADVYDRGAPLIEAIVEERAAPEWILRILRALGSDCKNPYTLHYALEVMLRQRPGAALAFIEEMSYAPDGRIELRSHYFWPILVHACQADGDAGILQVLRQMRALNVPCDEQTIETYVLPKLSELEQPLVICEELAASNALNGRVCAQLVKRLLYSCPIEASIEVCEKYSALRFDTQLLIADFNRLVKTVQHKETLCGYARLFATLRCCAQAPDLDLAGCLLIQMLNVNVLDTALQEKRAKQCEVFLNACRTRHGLKLSTAAVDRVIEQLSDNTISGQRLERLVDMLLQMRDPELRLPAAAMQLAADTAVPAPVYDPKKVVALNEFFKVARENDVHKALRIAKSIDSKTANARTLAEIAAIHTRDKGAAAEQMWKIYHRRFPRHRMDTYQTISYATQLVRDGAYEQAIEMLKNQHGVVAKPENLAVVCNLLEEILHYAASNSSQAISDEHDDISMPLKALDLLRKRDYCELKQHTVSPFVDVYLQRGDIRRAVQMFEFVAKNFKLAPCGFKLFLSLIGLCNNQGAYVQQYGQIAPEEARELLNRVCSTWLTVQSKVHMLHALVFALAQTGTEQQLREQLLHSEYICDKDGFLLQCDTLATEREYNTLLRLARSLRGVPHPVTEEDIYWLMLRTMIPIKQHNAALKLYIRLLEDNSVTLSKQFHTEITNFLHTQPKTVYQLERLGKPPLNKIQL